MCQPADHPNGKVIAAIIDAEKVQEAARIERLLIQGRRYQETGDVRSFTRPVITEEVIYKESPHQFLNDAIVAAKRSFCFLCGKELTVNEKTSHGCCMPCWMASHD